MLTSADYATLDSLMGWLASPRPFFTAGLHPRRHVNVLAVCGNWYDATHKADELIKAARRRPQATLLLTGGRAERLTPPEAVTLGGEPMLLQSILKQRGIEPRRMVLYTGSRITNHNLRAMLMYAQSVQSFEKHAINMTIFEEAFLVRREAAALHALLHRSTASAAASALSFVRLRPVGPRTFAGLVETHGGRRDVALALVLGEVSRLRAYSQNASSSGSGSDDDVVLDTRAAALEVSLAAAIDRLAVRHSGLVTSGKALLADPAKLWASGAAPRTII